MRLANNIFLLKNSFEEKLKEIFLTLVEIQHKIVEFKEVLILNNSFVKLDGILLFENEISTLLNRTNPYVNDNVSLPIKNNQSISLSLKDILFELDSIRFNLPRFGYEDDISRIDIIKGGVANLVNILETKFAL